MHSPFSEAIHGDEDDVKGINFEESFRLLNITPNDFAPIFVS